MRRRTLLRRVAAGCSLAPAASDRDRPASETAVVDRIEDGVVTLLFDDGRGRTVDADVLPPDAREEGLVLYVPGGEALALASPDRRASRRRRRDAQTRFDDLAERPTGQASGNGTEDA